jgi:ferredoxin-NADP reductase
MLPQWQNGTVIRLEEATPGTRRYWLQLADTDNFHFAPGQFVTFDLPIHEQRNKRWRSYSIASMPDGSNIVELIISFVPGGPASEYLFNEVKEGSVLTLRGPQGVFVLPAQLDKETYLICTGTGIAPYRSMLLYIAHHNITHQPIHLIYGTRHQSGLLYSDEMRQLEQKIPDFSYHPVLSRDQWEGRTGYVHNVYEELCLEKKPSNFMLCGWKEMIDEARHRIQALGYDKKNIHLELYG